MNHLTRKRHDPIRVFLYILFISLLLAVSVTTAASAPTINAIVTATEHGSMTPSGLVPADTLFEIRANTDYHIVMTDDGKVTPDLGNYIMYKSPNPNSDHTISVTFAPDIGSLDVRSDPKGAIIYIDGVNVGLTPETVEVSAGTHELRLTYVGFVDDTSTVIVGKGKTTKVDRNLVQQTPTATTPTTTPTATTQVSVSSTPSGASVYLDGTNKGTTPLTIPSVTYGTHTLRITYPGYQDSSNPVTVSESSHTYAYTLTATPVGTCLLYTSPSPRD